jgi:hypothetical protein
VISCTVHAEPMTATARVHSVWVHVVSAVAVYAQSFFEQLCVWASNWVGELELDLPPPMWSTRIPCGSLSGVSPGQWAFACLGVVS